MGKKMNLALSRPMEAKVKTSVQSAKLAENLERIFGEKPLNNIESNTKNTKVLQNKKN